MGGCPLVRASWHGLPALIDADRSMSPAWTTLMTTTPCQCWLRAVGGWVSYPIIAVVARGTPVVSPVVGRCGGCNSCVARLVLLLECNVRFGAMCGSTGTEQLDWTMDWTILQMT